MKIFAVTLAALALPAAALAGEGRQLATIDAQATLALTSYFATCPATAGDLTLCLGAQNTIDAKIALKVALNSEAYIAAAAKFTQAVIAFGIDTANAGLYLAFRKSVYIYNVITSVEISAGLSVDAKGDLVLGESWVTFLTELELALINGYKEDDENPRPEGERTATPTTLAPSASPDATTDAPVKSPTKAPTIATSINWAVKGMVGPVLNQGSCGSCWAFAAVSASQGLSAIETGYLNEVSPQQLVDCAPEGDCGGGNYVSMWRSSGYLNTNFFSTSASYSYTAKTETCATTGEAVLKTKGLVQLSGRTAATDVEIKAQLRIQPLSVSISAGCSAFSSYKSGILTASACVSGCSAPRIDHAVLLVGFGIDPSTEQEFWIVQNSWGTSWGEEGFVRIAMNGDVYNSDMKAYGACGINANPAAPESTETKSGCEGEACGGKKVSAGTGGDGDDGKDPGTAAASTTLSGAIALGAIFLAQQNM